MALKKVMIALLLLLLLQQQALATSGGGGDPGYAADLRYRGRRRGFRHRNSPQTPTPPVQQPVRPPPPPPTFLCNDTFGPEVSLTASGDVCVPMPAPPVPHPRCPPCTCTCPRPQPPRPFPGWPRVPLPVPGRGNIDCVTPLSPLFTCVDFVTSNDKETPTPTGECCTGLAKFLRASTAAAAAGGGDHILRCLCPFILGDVNKVIPKPVDPMRMMFLPIACGVVLPPQILYVCFTGAPVVTNFPQNSEGGQSP